MVLILTARPPSPHYPTHRLGPFHSRRGCGGPLRNKLAPRHISSHIVHRSSVHRAATSAAHVIKDCHASTASAFGEEREEEFVDESIDAAVFSFATSASPFALVDTTVLTDEATRN